MIVSPKFPPSKSGSFSEHSSDSIFSPSKENRDPDTPPVDPTIAKLKELFQVLPIAENKNEIVDSLVFLLKGLNFEYFKEIIEFHGIDLLKKLLMAAQYRFLGAHEILFQRKDQAFQCYVVLSGKVGCYMDDINVIRRRLKRVIRKRQKNSDQVENILRNIKEISEYTPGEMIGEHAILSDVLEKHMMTAIAKEDCYLLYYHKDTYQNIVCKKTTFLNVLN